MHALDSQMAWESPVKDFLGSLVACTRQHSADGISGTLSQRKHRSKAAHGSSMMSEAVLGTWV